MSKQLINQYYNQAHALKRAGVKNEMAIKQPFDTLLLQMATPKHYVYATEITIKNENGKNIRPDGTLMNELRIHKGYVESKDTDDSIDEEINKKLYKDGYPKTNILFQDSVEAVLIQYGEEAMRIQMKDADRLDAILKAFIDYKPEYVQKFDEALSKFKEDIPTIVHTLRTLIEEQNKTNETYAKARDAFWKMCQQEINPDITMEDIREMVVQHILTEDLFKSVFNESDFHRENNIAHELEQLVNSFMNREVRQNQLGALNHYYETLNAQASAVADHYEKQKFLKVVYENFYKVYNPKGADRLGVVYTPNEIVGFMIRSTDHLLEKHFGRNLHDQNVHILDPATGTGTFITDIIEYIPAQYLRRKYESEIHANEVAILPYYVANLNIEFTYKQKMGEYVAFPNICFVDTLDNTSSLSWGRMSKDQGMQTNIFGGISSENAARIKQQNKQKISVVIGNPPYNANQANFNDFNKSREYPFIDKRIKETFVKNSTAQKTKVYDMYARFFRWAMDRVDDNGIVSFITNRSFIDSRTFDGFRKSVQDDFDYCYIVDTRSDVRANPKIAGTTHNVFGIQTGVAMMFLVRKAVRNENGCQIYYNGEIEDHWRKEEKLQWIEGKQFSDIVFERITPQKNNWINLTDNDWEELIPLCDKQVKLGKSKEAVFKLFSLGVVTARDEWVYDFDKKNLNKKIEYFHKVYEKNRSKYGGIKKLENLSDKLDQSIKWTEELEKHVISNHPLTYNEKYLRPSHYRPFIKKYNYFNHLVTHRPYQNDSIWGIESKKENLAISFSGVSSSKPFQLLVQNNIFGLDCLEKTQCLPLYRYASDGTRHSNMTDWGLTQFQTHYSDKNITKENIFHYTYGVLHYPAYRKKYKLNLKREFPRLPFYKDFHQWAAWGKAFMQLHIGYEDARLYELKQTDLQSIIKGADQKRVFNNGTVDPLFGAKGKIKVKLKAKKEEGIIELDEQTSLSGIPPEAWDYKLGNRSALEWIIDQYKEKKPKDKTIAEQFNTYRFADYKDQVIELLKKVTTVSVETMKIIKQMEGVDA